MYKKYLIKSALMPMQGMAGQVEGQTLPFQMENMSRNLPGNALLTAQAGKSMGHALPEWLRTNQNLISGNGPMGMTSQVSRAAGQGLPPWLRATTGGSSVSQMVHNIKPRI